jgi:S1-C subfamily serine protease
VFISSFFLETENQTMPKPYIYVHPDARAQVAQEIAMKAVRILLVAIILAAAFFWYTTHNRGPIGPTSWAGNSGKLEITEAQNNTAQQLDSEEQVNVSVYKKALPSVVNITATAYAFNIFYGVMPQRGMGTGFILDKEGHILTNFHVVKDAQRVEVTLSNRKKYKADVIGRDPAHDLAVVKITAAGLTPAVLGDSRNLLVGQKVFAIGNPFGLNGTMTRGIISSIRPVETPNGPGIDDAIQTDAAINPGNSGGPLLNSKAEVIGINSMIITGGSEQSSGVGFAIPINTAKALLSDLVTRGTVLRPTLGATGLPIDPGLAEQIGLPADYGVLVQHVAPGSGAAAAGIHAGTERAYLGNAQIVLGGDLIVAIDGQEVEDLSDIARAMNLKRVGDTVTVTVFRGKRKLDLKVTLGQARERT